MTTILHVEDDPVMHELVEQAFGIFGFRGQFVFAPTVARAHAALADRTAYPRLDLVISDMHLPDGTAFDVLRYLHESPGREYVPALVLSGDTDPDTINRAYALGANAYIPKQMRGRSELEILRTVFEHWIKDVLLPTPSSRTHSLIATAVQIRRRVANLFLSFIERLPPSPPDAAFWMDLSLREGNLANLFAFVLSQIGTHELPNSVLDEGEAMHSQYLDMLDNLDAHPVRSMDDATRALVWLISHLHTEAFARVSSRMFPASAAIMPALHDLAATTIESVAAWLEHHVNNPDVRTQLPQLREQASRIRSIDANA